MGDNAGAGKKEAGQISVEDLPAVYKVLCGLIGLDNALIVGRELGGQSFYFPRLDPALTKARDRQIVQEFNGRNYKELAKKYRLTETWLREILKRSREAKVRMV